MNIRNLSDMINEIICDNLLRKFEENKCIARENVREQEFYANIDPDLEVVEDHIHFLIRDNTLKDTGSAISLTTKGWFILTNADKVGYVAQRIEIAKREHHEKESRMLYRWTSLGISITLATWLTYSLMNT